MRNYFTVHREFALATTQLKFVPFHSSKEFFAIIFFLSREISHHHPLRFISLLFVPLCESHTRQQQDDDDDTNSNNNDAREERKKKRFRLMIINRKHNFINDFSHHQTIYFARYSPSFRVCTEQHHSILEVSIANTKHKKCLILSLKTALTHRKHFFFVCLPDLPSTRSPMFTSSDDDEMKLF